MRRSVKRRFIAAVLLHIYTSAWPAERCRGGATLDFDSLQFWHSLESRRPYYWPFENLAWWVGLCCCCCCCIARKWHTSAQREGSAMASKWQIIMHLFAWLLVYALWSWRWWWSGRCCCCCGGMAQSWWLLTTGKRRHHGTTSVGNVAVIVKHLMCCRLRLQNEVPASGCQSVMIGPNLRRPDHDVPRRRPHFRAFCFVSFS